MTLQASPGHPAPDLTPAVGSAASPFWPRHLVALFVRPTQFFTSELALGKTPYFLLVAWLLGISMAIEQIATDVMHAGLSPDPRRLDDLKALFGTWPALWAFVLTVGAVIGILQWWIGGWWCKVQLLLSGAPSPDARLARLLLVYSSLVFAAPVVLILIAETALDSNYFEAPHNAALVGLAMLVGIPWFIGTLYKGALALFPVRRGWARVWFVVLPTLFLVAFAIVGAKT